MKATMAGHGNLTDKKIKEIILEQQKLVTEDTKNMVSSTINEKSTNTTKGNFDELKDIVGNDVLLEIGSFLKVDLESISPNRAEMIDYSYPAVIDFGFLITPESLKTYLSDNKLKSENVEGSLLKTKEYRAFIYCNILCGKLMDYKNFVNHQGIDEREYDSIMEKLKNIAGNLSNLSVDYLKSEK